ncbi:hypothetical protein VTN31DRAFT_3085 [Thermomyces dupontii]|uniref:uncharacterized protein n=1 Tax=Talaromyces thermophilus TaxID=28565 RepID=UPI0037430950
MHPSKRQKVDHEVLADGDRTIKTLAPRFESPVANLRSLERSISPPARSKSQQTQPQSPPNSVCCSSVSTGQHGLEKKHDPATTRSRPKHISSPFKLTYIRDIPFSTGNNNETVQLRDILGDPMIRECWQFNYLFDVDFLMNQFDEDVRSIVQVKIVHGSWKKESENRIRIDEACARYPNVEAITAYMPEPFGTHHSKMMVLLRHDNLTQIVIHTANMIPGDWANMCQAVWQSPLLPLESTTPHTNELPAFGTGARFKRDLLSYLEFYGQKRTGSLVQQLRKYDFSTVRAALIASVPSKQKLSGLDSNKSTLWGWPALRDIVKRIPIENSANNHRKPHIVIQVSSIASLGQTDKWLKDVLFHSLCPNPPSPTKPEGPQFSIIFPTPDEIRRSLNGYGSGGSIHMKLQTPAQQKQLQYLRPYLCQWAGDQHDDFEELDVEKGTTAHPTAVPKREAGRRRAAPHIKTYIRFSDDSTMDQIDWAMVTSANLSTQAWGSAANANGEVRICSWEIGVLVWPSLIAGTFNSPDDAHVERSSENCQSVVMRPCFKTDLPSRPSVDTDSELDDRESIPSTVVGLRMPYDLPLTRYRAHDVPWCNTVHHSEPDWLGQTWE